MNVKAIWTQFKQTLLSLFIILIGNSNRNLQTLRNNGLV